MKKYCDNKKICKRPQTKFFLKMKAFENLTVVYFDQKWVLPQPFAGRYHLFQFLTSFSVIMKKSLKHAKILYFPLLVHFFCYFFFLTEEDGKIFKLLKKMISSSIRGAKNPFAGWNTQHSTLSKCSKKCLIELLRI